MTSTGVPGNLVSIRVAKGDSGRNNAAPRAKFGKSSINAAAMIAPLEKPIKTGLLLQ